jgi:hypothetical protein
MTWIRLSIKTRVSKLKNHIYKVLIDGKTDVIHYVQDKVVIGFDARLIAIQSVTALYTEKRTPEVYKSM